MKILYSVLNKERDILVSKRNLVKIPKSKEDGTYILTDDRFKWSKTKFEIGNIEESIAKSKNKILKKAIKEGYDYCAIIEDDIKFLDKNIVKEYISLMEKYDLSVSFNSFINKNCSLNNQPNPSMIVRTNDAGDEVVLTRYPCSALMVFKIEKDMVLFNDQLKLLELDVLLKDNANVKKIPFLGFYFDLKRSWEKLKREDMRTVRLKNRADQQADLKIIGGPIALNNNADEVLNYIKNKNNIK